jgi:hypothetical protein
VGVRVVFDAADVLKAGIGKADVSAARSREVV